MASPSTVLTLGLGSFGSSSLLLTLGFGVGEVATPDYAPPLFTISRLHVGTKTIARQNAAVPTIARLHVKTLEIKQ